MTDRYDRARGALWGQAIGDALGTTFEFETANDIAARAPSAWPDELVGDGPFRLLPGQVTDDTELALALARSLVRRGGYDDEDAARSYVRWRGSNPFDAGMATTLAFGGLVGVSAAGDVRARASRTTQANGSLMRSSPLGIFGHALPREQLATFARNDSLLSHPDPVPQAACAVFVTTLADAIRTGDSGPVLFERAVAFAKGSPVGDTLEAARTALPESDGDKQGWVRIALQHAFFHLLHAKEPAGALVQTVLAGGDTDTNAAIAGALLGAVFGVGAFPPAWRRAVGACQSPRPPEYRCNDLDALADALVSLSS